MSMKTSRYGLASLPIRNRASSRHASARWTITMRASSPRSNAANASFTRSSAIRFAIGIGNRTHRRANSSIACVVFETVENRVAKTGEIELVNACVTIGADGFRRLR
jgi:hypothetical protein